MKKRERERGKGGGQLKGDESNKKVSFNSLHTPTQEKTRRSLIKTQTKGGKITLRPPRI
jgi:hypothetical protein